MLGESFVKIQAGWSHDPLSARSLMMAKSYQARGLAHGFQQWRRRFERVVGDSSIVFNGRVGRHRTAMKSFVSGDDFSCAAPEARGAVYQPVESSHQPLPGFVEQSQLFMGHAYIADE